MTYPFHWEVKPSISPEIPRISGKWSRPSMGGGIPILEGINLEGVPVGRYTLYTLPIKIRGGDGAPVRAVLMV